MTVFEPLHAMEKRLRSLEGQMAEPAVYNNPHDYERVMKEYDALQIEVQRLRRLSI